MKMSDTFKWTFEFLPPDGKHICCSNIEAKTYHEAVKKLPARRRPLDFLTNVSSLPLYITTLNLSSQFDNERKDSISSISVTGTSAEYVDKLIDILRMFIGNKEDKLDQIIKKHELAKKQLDDMLSNIVLAAE